MPAWRYLESDRVSASEGLAVDEALLRSATRPGAPPATLRLYTYRSHCALVGRFQDVGAEVDVGFCGEHDLQVNRRLTGGGAILMGEGQLGVALTTSPRFLPIPSELTEQFRWFATGLVAGLRSLGIAAEFHPRNDIMVAGRKIAGTGVYRDAQGGLLFHASLLCDLDIPLMLRALRIPVQKISDKPIASVEERTTTVTRELHGAVPLRQLRETLRNAWAEVSGVDLRPESLTREEASLAEELVRERYGTAAWLSDRTPASPNGAPHWGQSVHRTPGGVLRVYVTRSAGVIQSLWITGDFFATSASVTGLESRLKWSPLATSPLRATVEREYERSGGIPGIAPAELAEAILEAGAASPAGGERAG